jgi:hypothetical protein
VDAVSCTAHCQARLAQTPVIYCSEVSANVLLFRPHLSTCSVSSIPYGARKKGLKNDYILGKSVRRTDGQTRFRRGKQATQRGIGERSRAACHTDSVHTNTNRVRGFFPVQLEINFRLSFIRSS